MTNEETLTKMLAQLGAADDAKAQEDRSTLVPGVHCVPFVRLVDAVMKDTVTAYENQHIVTCRICQRTVANVQAVKHSHVDAQGNLSDANSGDAR